MLDTWIKRSSNCTRFGSLVRCLEADTLSRGGAFGRLSAEVDVDSLAKVDEVKHSPIMKLIRHEIKRDQGRQILRKVGLEVLVTNNESFVSLAIKKVSLRIGGRIEVASE